MPPGVLAHTLTEHDDRCSVLARIYRTQDVTMHLLVLTKLSLHRCPATYPCEQNGRTLGHGVYSTVGPSWLTC
jgi:hypothetical protein